MDTVSSNMGGWFPKNIQTGSVCGMKNLLVASTVGLLISTGTGAHTDALAQMQQQKLRETLISSPSIDYISEIRIARTPVEEIERVREVLKPAISDLAKCFQVSRQSIYNWLNGEQPSFIHLATLKDLALAADILSNSGFSISGYTLKRKITNGRNLLEVVQHGGSASDAAHLLIQILNKETTQRESLSARLAGRSMSQDFVDSDLMQENDNA